MRSWRTLLLASLILLAGCQPGDDGLALQEDYLQRLDRVLQSEGFQPFEPGVMGLFRMPPRRERLIEIAELRISLLDLLLDLDRCPQLQQTISQRNSILGVHLQPSSRLAHEGELLRGLQQCITYLQAKDEQTLVENLQLLQQGKREQLPAVFWNALNGSREFEHYLRFAPQALPRIPVEDDAALDALEQLAQLGSQLPQALPPPLGEIDAWMFALHASDQGGQLITSLASLTHTLDEASRLLEERQSRRPVCPLGRATERGTILQTIFVKFYAGSLQPYMALVDQRGQSWSGSLRRLAQVREIPPAMQNYLLRLSAEEDSLWADFQAATDRHVRIWQKMLGSCGLAPGQPGWKPQAS